MSNFTANRAAKTQIHPQSKIVFRHYVTFNDGKVEYISEKPKCGELWMCNLGENESSIQSGYRPVFIVSNNKNNAFSPTVNVLPLTTKMNKRKLPVHVEILDYARFGLEAPSTIMAEQITTIPTSRLDKKIGQIDDCRVLSDIFRAMTIQLPIMGIGRTSGFKE